VARAKKTARADARRKYRAEQGLPADDDTIDESPVAATTPQRATASPGERMSIGAAFRRSFTPIDLPGDLRALPSIAIHSKALWLPALITVGATIGFYFTHGEDLVTRFLFAYFIQTPAIGGVFLAGFLAPRASWLLGVIIGLLAAACYTFLILTVFSAVTIVAPAPGLTQDIITSAFVLSPVMGAFFAAAAAWYRRFLAMSNPNRGRREAAAKAGSKPDGRSRGSASKASTSRR